jgi:hypothetical protein
MSLDTMSKSFLNQDDILEEINRIKFMLDNLQKEKADILGKSVSHKRKFDFITDDFEYDSYDSGDTEYYDPNDYIIEVVKISRTH